MPVAVNHEGGGDQLVRAGRALLGAISATRAQRGVERVARRRSRAGQLLGGDRHLREVGQDRRRRLGGLRPSGDSVGAAPRCAGT